MYKNTEMVEIGLGMRIATFSNKTPYFGGHYAIGYKH